MLHIYYCYIIKLYESWKYVLDNWHRLMLSISMDKEISVFVFFFFKFFLGTAFFIEKIVKQINSNKFDCCAFNLNTNTELARAEQYNWYERFSAKQFAHAICRGVIDDRLVLKNRFL